jgi:hypothetical protein
MLFRNNVVLVEVDLPLRYNKIILVVFIYFTKYFIGRLSNKYFQIVPVSSKLRCPIYCVFHCYVPLAAKFGLWCPYDTLVCPISISYIFSRLRSRCLYLLLRHKFQYKLLKISRRLFLDELWSYRSLELCVMKDNNDWCQEIFFTSKKTDLEICSRVKNGTHYVRVLPSMECMLAVGVRAIRIQPVTSN